MTRAIIWTVCAAALALTACAGPPRTGAQSGPVGAEAKPPSASPGCDARNICRIYVALEPDGTGKETVHVYPETLYISTKAKDANIVWIILNADVAFRDARPIAIQRGDATQWTDKYPTDDDDGNVAAAAGFRPKNFHGRFPIGAKADTYKYAITVQRDGAAPVTRDPTIVNSN